MGAAAAAEADGARGPSRREVRQGLLRIRREREEKAVEAIEREATTKAAAWGAIAGLAHIAAPAFGAGYYPDWFFLLTSVAYGLMLPLVAVLHVRHLPVRQSGAMLGTISGVSVIVIGVAASAAPQLAVAALFVRAIWWWTIGKLWWETDVVARWLGAVTLGLAVGEFALVLALGPLGADMSVAWLPLRVLLGVWVVVLSIELWRTRHQA